jgi:hypothetical protein
MPTLLIQLLITIAQQYPQLREDVENMRTKAGVPDDKWNAEKRKLDKTASSYFSGAVDTPPPVVPDVSVYDHWLNSDPGDGALKAGDYVYAVRQPGEEPGTLGPWRWWIHEGGAINFGFVGAPKPENLVRVVTK